MRKLILFLCLAGYAVAATQATAVWEIRTAGADTNGGGFDSGISGAGTDMSQFDNKNATSCTSCQSATVNLSKADAVTSNSTTVTSATANFSSALIGNAVYLAGTGTTTGWYWVTAVGSSTSITVDRATGSTGGTGVTINIGGALLTLSQAFTNTVAGNYLWAKSGTFSIAAGITWSTSCTNAAPCKLEGYGSTRGDGTQFTLQASGSVTTMFTDGGVYHYIKNMICDGNTKASTSCFNISTGTPIYLSNLLIENWTVKGITLTGNGAVLTNSVVTGGQSGCTAAVNTQGRMVLRYNRITANACHGISTTGTGGLIALNNIIDANTGASTDGINLAIAPVGSSPQVLIGNDIYNNGRWGINSAVTNGFDYTVMERNIISANATGGINSTTTVYPSTLADYDVYWNNGGDTGTTTTHNLTNFAYGPHDFCAASCGGTISGNPYTSSSNFALNSTTGAGAALRASGFPGALQSGGTGYIDIGALQHQDTGSSPSPTSSPIVQ